MTAATPPEEPSLDLADLAADPFAQFARWFADAEAARVSQPEAMTLATVDPDGVPDARTVLLRAVRSPPHEDAGFHFFTNYLSSKGRQLDASGAACLLFHWEPMARQVRIRGPVRRLSAEASDAYFATRPRGSQLGAWASPQSSPIGSRAELDARVAEVEARFAGQPVPRPPHWGGFVVAPRTVEFWQGRTFRLHDRFVFTADGPGWRLARLAP